MPSLSNEVRKSRRSKLLVNQGRHFQYDVAMVDLNRLIVQEYPVRNLPEIPLVHPEAKNVQWLNLTGDFRWYSDHFIFQFCRFDFIYGFLVRKRRPRIIKEYTVLIHVRKENLLAPFNVELGHLARRRSSDIQVTRFKHGIFHKWSEDSFGFLQHDEENGQKLADTW
ncbi:hypothetical protein RvY_01818 [Ramazzottius varieornatus]|uniref:Uncharacterized protein n=1 Tax=Ramazzottius varieornatus TaxID=947166 RepID=A0A1D1UHT7_RAMVA|nr:hypothetical protein RvY_01818 [Ramazzottius varieornatus]